MTSCTGWNQVRPHGKETGKNQHELQCKRLKKLVGQVTEKHIVIT